MANKDQQVVIKRMKIASDNTINLALARYVPRRCACVSSASLHFARGKQGLSQACLTHALPPLLKLQERD